MLVCASLLVVGQWQAVASCGRQWPAAAGSGLQWLASGRQWPAAAGSGQQWQAGASSGQPWPAAKAGRGRPDAPSPGASKSQGPKCSSNSETRTLPAREPPSRRVRNVVLHFDSETRTLPAQEPLKSQGLRGCISDDTSTNRLGLIWKLDFRTLPPREPPEV